MGSFRVTVEVANTAGEPQFTPVEPLVDTGATFSVFPASFLENLGISPVEEQHFSLADGSVQAYGLGLARFRIGGRERVSTVTFGEEGAFSWEQ